MSEYGRNCAWRQWLANPNAAAIAGALNSGRTRFRRSTSINVPNERRMRTRG
jgi:hypothetical protein